MSDFPEMPVTDLTLNPFGSCWWVKHKDYETLEKERDELKNSIEWISVKDILPSVGCCLICFAFENHRKIGWAFYNSEGKFCADGGFVNDITHWMKLPEPPK